MNKLLVSIVLPVYNESQVLTELLQRIRDSTRPLENKYEFEFILVDDCSQDNSIQVAKDFRPKDPRLRIVELRRNFGQTAALQAGMDRARGQIVISMDSDLQHFPEEIPLFLDKIESGFDVVCGWRRDRREGIIRRWPSSVANFLIRWVSGLYIHDIGTTYRAYRAEIIQDFQLLGDNHRFVPVFAKIVGAKIGEVPIKNIVRPYGKSNYGISRTTNVFLDLLFLFFYTRYFDKPIRIFGRLALVMIFLSGAIAATLLGIFILFHTPVVREHSGWFILSMVLFLSGIQIILSGIIAEVITRLYFKPGERTHYRVRSEWIHKDI